MAWHKLLFIGVAALNLVLLAGLVFGEHGLFAYLAMHERHAGLTRQIEAADAMSRELSREIRLMNSDPGYQEMVVRDELNYLRANEVLYLFEDGQTGKGATHARED